MRCDHVRESMSALLDGEAAELNREEVDRHLVTCPDCRSWHEAVTGINRTAALGPADSHDAPPAWLADAVMAHYRVSRRLRLRQLTRGALLVVALAQLGIGILGIVPRLPGLAGHSHGALPGLDGHLGTETAAFNLAIGAALLWITLRPWAADGPLPLLGTFAVALGALSVADLAAGQVSWERLASHLPMLLGALLAALLTRLHAAPGPRPGDLDTSAHPERESEPTSTRLIVADGPAKARDHRPPAATA